MSINVQISYSRHNPNPNTASGALVKTFKLGFAKYSTSQNKVIHFQNKTTTKTKQNHNKTATKQQQQRNKNKTSNLNKTQQNKTVVILL